jgi:hypothetical protein
MLYITSIFLNTKLPACRVSMSRKSHEGAFDVQSDVKEKRSLQEEGVGGQSCVD